MSDQQAPSPHEDSPAVAGPNEAPGAAQEQAEVDWQKRYVDTQAEYSRNQQRLRDLENQQQWYELALTSEDADTRRQAIEALGYELPEEEEFEPADDEIYQDPYDQLQAQLAAVQQRLDQGEQQLQDEQVLEYQQQLVEEQLSGLEGVDEDDKDDILAYAINALPAVQQPGLPPLPDIGAAYERFQARQTERQKQWAKTKRAPYVAPGGQTANEVPDLSTHDGRVTQAMRKMAENEMAE